MHCIQIFSLFYFIMRFNCHDIHNMRKTAVWHRRTSRHFVACMLMCLQFHPRAQEARELERQTVMARWCLEDAARCLEAAETAALCSLHAMLITCSIAMWFVFCFDCLCFLNVTAHLSTACRKVMSQRCLASRTVSISYYKLRT